MAFNSANLTFTGKLDNNIVPIYKWTYNAGSDTKANVRGANYFPKGHLRSGDVVAVTASDGNSVIVMAEGGAGFDELSGITVVEY